MFSNKNRLNVLDVFQGMPEYVIMRIPILFPQYEVPSDLDILCLDIDACSHHIQSKVDVRLAQVTPTQIHLDHFVDGKLDLKFDLYGEYISPQFKQDALSEARLSPIHNVWVPIVMDDLASKCYEYLVHGKEKYKDYKQYKYILDEYITL